VPNPTNVSHLTALLERFVLLREWSLFEPLVAHFIPFVSHLVRRHGLAPHLASVLISRVLAAARTALERGDVQDLAGLTTFLHESVRTEVRLEPAMAVVESIHESSP
jgi:hypothetical protein